MYWPSKYKDHNDSLDRWIPLFNETDPKYITAKRESRPGIRDVVIDLLGKKIGMDWQKRSRKHWKEGGKFPFVELGQFERKFDSHKEIALSIQCNNEETAFVVAWHKDFGESIEIERDTENGELEKGGMRTTKKFKEFMYEEISDFKSWLLKTHARARRAHAPKSQKLQEVNLFKNHTDIKTHKIYQLSIFDVNSRVYSCRELEAMSSRELQRVFIWITFDKCFREKVKDEYSEYNFSPINYSNDFMAMEDRIIDRDQFIYLYLKDINEFKDWRIQKIQALKKARRLQEQVRKDN